MPTDITSKQASVLEFIESYQMTHGSSPTIREIRAFLNVSSDNSVLKHLDALERKGYLSREATPRGIHLLQSVRDRLEKPDITLRLLGAVAAGNPGSVDQDAANSVSVAETLVPSPQDCFLLKVQGDSMIDAGIHDGDMVVVHTKRRPKNNDIVVALIDNENTVKRFIQKGGTSYLKPENPAFKELYPVNELVMQGVVIAVFRTYR